MPRYEYKVVPAPQRGLKGKGIKGPEGRFSNALETLINAMAEDGWDYQRAETLPSIERSGLTSTTTEWRNVLVFRRLRETATEAFAPELLPPPESMPEVAPKAAEPEPEKETVEAAVEVEDVTEKAEVEPDVTEDKEVPKVRDNGVEDTDDVEGIGTSVEKLAAYRNSLKSDD